VVAEGAVKKIEQNKKSLTGKFLSGKEKILIPKRRTTFCKDKFLELKGVKGNNLKSINLKLPIGLFTCVTGVSGSGKSTLINHTLYPIAATKLNNASTLTPGPFESINGLRFLDKVVDIDQSPIGRTPRSNPATYTGIFTPVRELFAGTQESCFFLQTRPF
jgi:Excinuclease ABC subunit A